MDTLYTQPAFTSFIALSVLERHLVDVLSAESDNEFNDRMKTLRVWLDSFPFERDHVLYSEVLELEKTLATITADDCFPSLPEVELALECVRTRLDRGTTPLLLAIPVRQGKLGVRLCQAILNGLMLDERTGLISGTLDTTKIIPEAGEDEDELPVADGEEVSFILAPDAFLTLAVCNQCEQPYATPNGVCAFCNDPRNQMNIGGVTALQATIWNKRGFTAEDILDAVVVVTDDDSDDSDVADTSPTLLLV